MPHHFVRFGKTRNASMVKRELHPSMPFPLAHPAAILPFRRLCPRRLNFPALVIGSLSPDLGYCFRALRLGAFSHRFLAGGFGFCLPVGFLLVQLFYLVRQPVVQRLPARHRQIFEPLCRRPIASPLVIALSLLIGAWTHSLLDSVSHANGWFAEHLPVLQKSLTAGNFHIHLYDLIYSACTFVGVAYVALAYQNWIERTAGSPDWTFPAFKRVSTPMLALLTLLLSF